MAYKQALTKLGTSFYRCLVLQADQCELHTAVAEFIAGGGTKYVASLSIVSMVNTLLIISRDVNMDRCRFLFMCILEDEIIVDDIMRFLDCIESTKNSEVIKQIGNIVESHIPKIPNSS